jgi:hypothetical protein
MNTQLLMPLLMFLAGAGFNEVAYAVDKLQKGVAGLGGSAGLPQMLTMLSGGGGSSGPGAGPPGGGAPGAPQGGASLGPNPLQALAAMDLKRRMAMMPDALMGGGGPSPVMAQAPPAVGRFGGQPGAASAFQQLVQQAQQGR